MEDSRLPLVDVNTDTVSSTWPLLLRAVDQADFIALDLELSGLGHGRIRRGGSPEERYKSMSAIADSHAVLSVGVACFQWAGFDPVKAEIGCKAEVFNIWLLCQRPYMIDPASAKFLMEHGFDFNKQFAKGLPYSPGLTQELDPTAPSPHALFARLLSSGRPMVVHNGWVDLLFLYHSFYSSLPPSHNTFMADLSQMYQGGIYDTKAIAHYQLSEEASFLEYIFRKCQRLNAQRQSTNHAHLKLCFTDYSNAPFVELVQTTPTPIISLEDVLRLPLCSTFASHGYCHQPQCPRCHDVIVVLEQEEHRAEVQRLKKMRKRALREQHKHRKSMEQTAGEDEGHPMSQESATSAQNRDISPMDLQPTDTHTPSIDLQPTDTRTLSMDLQPTDTHTPSMVELFQKDLEAARSRLPPSPPPTITQKPSHGHRAGFDAFMTGYTFAVYATMFTQQLGAECSNETMLSGVTEMRNCLANRGREIPIQIAKSHFSRTSEGHRRAQDRIQSVFSTTAAQS